MNVSRSPISCSSASSDRLYNAPRTIALNIGTASHGLRPAADLRFSSAFRQYHLEHGPEVLPRDQFADHRQMPAPLLPQLPPPAFGRHIRKTQLPAIARSCHLSSPGLRCRSRPSECLM